MLGERGGGIHIPDAFHYEGFGQKVVVLEFGTARV